MKPDLFNPRAANALAAAESAHAEGLTPISGIAVLFTYGQIIERNPDLVIHALVFAEVYAAHLHNEEARTYDNFHHLPGAAAGFIEKFASVATDADPAIQARLAITWRRFIELFAEDERETRDFVVRHVATTNPVLEETAKKLLPSPQGRDSDLPIRPEP